MTDLHQVQFNNHLVEFIQKLQLIAPAEERLFRKYYKYYRTRTDQGQRIEFIAEFIQYLSKYNKEVSVCDENLFSEEPTYYPNKPIQLMKGIDFKKLWRQPQMSEESKKCIWRYLHVLFIIGTHILKELDRYKELWSKQQKIVEDLLQTFKYEEKIKRASAALIKKEDDSAKGSFDFAGLNELFDENNIITQIAFEIAQEFKNSIDLPNDPIQAIQKLFSRDGEKLQEIIGKVGQHLQKILQTKGVTEEQLLDQAKSMHNKLHKVLSGIPGLSNIEKLSQKFVDEFTKGLAPQNSEDPKVELEKCQTFMQELTNNLQQNFSQMGMDNLEQFQKNLQKLVPTEGKESGTGSVSSTTPQPQPQPQPENRNNKQ
jgi:hypothetical protein